MRSFFPLGFCCLLAAGCATTSADTAPGALLTLHRPDGTPAVCTRPPQQWLDAQEGVAVAAGLPDLVQTLMSPSKPDRDKLDVVARDAPTRRAVGVLDYRLCLAYGKGTLTREAYTDWLLDLRPRAYQVARNAQDHG